MAAYNSLKTIFFTATVWILAAVFWTGQPNAHGPGGHGDNTFTALQAADKGMELYDRLVEEGKLEGTWETQLTAIKVDTRCGYDRSKKQPQAIESRCCAPGYQTGGSIIAFFASVGGNDYDRE